MKLNRQWGPMKSSRTEEIATKENNSEDWSCDEPNLGRSLVRKSKKTVRRGERNYEGTTWGHSVVHQSLLPLGAKGTIWMAAGEDRFKSPQIDQRLSKNRRVVWSEVQGWCVYGTTIVSPERSSSAQLAVVRGVASRCRGNCRRTVWRRYRQLL